MGTLIMFLVVLVFAGVVFLIAKKDNDERKEMIAKLTEEDTYIEPQYLRPRNRAERRALNRG